MTDIRFQTATPELGLLVVAVLLEMEQAQLKHPVWPEDNVKRISIVSGECGEAVREANLIDSGKGSLDNLKTELIQTAGTCLRMLLTMEKEASI